jgi:hypothetical protein
VGVDPPLGDAGGVGARGKVVVGLGGRQPGVEVDFGVPAFGEGDVAAADGAEPVGGYALDGELELLGGEEVEALVAEAGSVYGILGVVAVIGDELGAASAATTAVPAASESEQPLSLGLHVTAVAGDDVAADEGGFRGRAARDRRRWRIGRGPQRAIRMEGSRRRRGGGTGARSAGCGRCHRLRSGRLRVGWVA